MLILAVAFVTATVFIDNSFGIENKGVRKHHKYERIVSLSPSITETIFAVGLGDKLIGRTRFCNYPPEAKNVAEVGGYFDPNYEALIALHPDLVILLPEHQKVKKYLKELSINYLEVNNKTVADIINSITTIGNFCGAAKKSEELVLKIENAITEIREKTKTLKKPGTIVSVGRTMGSGVLKEAYIAGPTTYFSELITIAGGVNVFKNKNLAYPKLTAEGLTYLNPDVIFDLVVNLKSGNLTPEKVVKEWQILKNISAVKNDRIFVLSNDYSVIPGPRFILLLKDFAESIHPEINWEN